MTAELISALGGLTAEQINAELLRLAEQERALRALLRSARAREREARKKQEREACTHAR